MKFSLIMATVARVTDVERFLFFLSEQSYNNFELIIVDQNKDDRLKAIIERYSDKISIIHIKSPVGLSKARNCGLRYATGDILAFPDDDCWYPPDLLKKVRDFLDAFHEYGGYIGRTKDENDNVVSGRFDKSGGIISLHNVWERQVSTAIFLKREIVELVGSFDEELGVGAGTLYGSGEETDYIIRAIKQGAALYYDPELYIYHPNPILHYDFAVVKRGFKYGCGMGRVLRKHNFPIHFVFCKLIRPLGGAFISLAGLQFMKAIYHGAVLVGRIVGYLR